MTGVQTCALPIYRTNNGGVPIEGTYNGDSLSISLRGAETYFAVGTYGQIGGADSTLALKSVTKNGSSVVAYVNATSFGTASNSTNCPNLTMYLGALNNNGNPGFYGNNEESFAYYGDGLSGTNITNLYTAVQSYQTSMARQV